MLVICLHPPPPQQHHLPSPFLNSKLVAITTFHHILHRPTGRQAGRHADLLAAALQVLCSEALPAPGSHVAGHDAELTSLINPETLPSSHQHAVPPFGCSPIV